MSEKTPTPPPASESAPGARKVWLDTDDDLYGDVLSSSPAGGTESTTLAADPTADPGPAPVPPSPSSVDWPDLDMDDEYAGRPDWQQWRRLQDQADQAARAAQAERAAEAAAAFQSAQAVKATQQAEAARAAQEVQAAKAAAAMQAAAAAKSAAAAQAATAAKTASHPHPPAGTAPPYQAPPSFPTPSRHGKKRRRPGAARPAASTNRATATASKQSTPSRATASPAATPRRAKRARWVPLVVLAVVMGGIGARTVIDQVGSDDRGSSSSSSGRANPEPALGSATKVAPTGATVPSVKDPKTVRLEVLAQNGSVGSVRYGSDAKDTTSQEDITLPWAVEAPLSAGNEFVSVSGSDQTPYTKGKTNTPVSTVICRIYLDGVKVTEMVGRGYASCDTSVDRFRTTRTDGDGEKLAAATAVTPATTTLPHLSGAAPTSVVFEAYSAGSSGDVGFGNSTTRSHLDDQTLPAAWRTALPAGVDYFGASVSDFSSDAQTDDDVPADRRGSHRAGVGGADIGELLDVDVPPHPLVSQCT